MMNCIIVDDDEMSRTHLKHLCSKIENLNITAVCENGIEALNIIENQEIDIAFLDIEMPDFTGLDLVKTSNKLPQIIFTTSHTDFALEAFEHDVTDYLTKPIQLARLIKAVNKAKGRLNKNANIVSEKEMYIKTNGKLVKLNHSEIIFIETLDDYLTIHTDSGEKHIIHSTLSKMDEKLKGNSFLKVHRSFIINLKKISSIEDTHVILGKKIIPVSRAHKKSLMDKVNLL